MNVFLEIGIPLFLMVFISILLCKRRLNDLVIALIGLFTFIILNAGMSAMHAPTRCMMHCVSEDLNLGEKFSFDQLLSFIIFDIYLLSPIFISLGIIGILRLIKKAGGK
jgi:hypothetical protein